MLDQVLLVTHIAVLGYWLGADLVINSTYRYACWSAGMPFDERNRLMDHVMKVDQHVRYALVLQFCIGPSIAALLTAGAAAAGWLALPAWLTSKLVLFGAVFIAGVGIRVELIRFFAAWTVVGEQGSTPAREAAVRQGYVRASAVLLGLWVLIGGIVVLSVWKPG